MTTSLHLVLKNRVARGAALLDSTMPTWYKYLNTKTLNLGTIDGCVLGQLFGSYFSGTRALFDDDGVNATVLSLAIEHGFEITDEFEDFEEYMVLTDVWREEVDRRA